MKFTHVHLTNFCNLKEFDADLYDKTIISGFNKEGKSTIRNAVLWVLTDKLSDNSAAGDSIRPHDENGKRIDEIEIRADLTVSIDGSEFILTKIQKQKWVKKRGSETQEFQGNENLYEISGVPKKARDFEQFIADNICDTAELPFCMNANAFLTLDSKKRRAKLMSMASDITDDDVIATNPAFEELRNDLKVGSLDELTKRSKGTIATLKKQQQEIPVRIDEANSQRVDYDFSALELERNGLKEQLADIEKQEQEVTDTMQQIMQAKFDLSAIEQKLNADVKEYRHSLELKLTNLKTDLRMATDDVTRLENEKEKEQVLIQNNEKAIVEAENQKETAANRVFDDSESICPKCHQKYPADMIDVLKADFEKQKQDEMNRLYDYIESLKSGKKSAADKIAEIDKRIADAKSVKDAYAKEISIAENEIANLVLADVSKDAEYTAKKAEIAALEDKAEKSTPNADKAEIKANIADCDRKLAQADTNNKIDDRIEELRAELKSVGEKILNQERLLHLLEEFGKARMEMLEKSVNKYFSIIKFRFWRPLINGGMEEVSQCLVNGTDYDGLLNKSDRLLCQADLVKGFQTANNVELPIALDDCESIDNGRIPAYSNQMLLFRREDCKLTAKQI